MPTKRSKHSKKAHMKKPKKTTTKKSGGGFWSFLPFIGGGSDTKSETKSVATKKVHRGCQVQTSEKYTSRPSPPYPANECKGSRRKGNDGRWWKSKPNAKGIHRWVAA